MIFRYLCKYNGSICCTACSSDSNKNILTLQFFSTVLQQKNTLKNKKNKVLFILYILFEAESKHQIMFKLINQTNSKGLAYNFKWLFKYYVKLPAQISSSPAITSESVYITNFLEQHPDKLDTQHSFCPSYYCMSH